jgi:putative FmdB family regulatory protein
LGSGALPPHQHPRDPLLLLQTDSKIGYNVCKSQKEGVFMPAYEYVCEDCNKEFIVLLSIKEFEAGPKTKCAHCQSDKVKKKLTGFFTKTSKKS